MTLFLNGFHKTNIPGNRIIEHKAEYVMPKMIFIKYGIKQWKLVLNLPRVNGA